MRAYDQLDNGIYQNQMKEQTKELRINNQIYMLAFLLDAGKLSKEKFIEKMMQVIAENYSKNPIFADLLEEYNGKNKKRRR